MKLKGKVVLITGGSRGIGKATKQLLELKGCKVVSPTREQCNLIFTWPVVRYIKSLKKPIDILINNAGVFTTSYSTQTWIESFNINVRAPFILIRELYENKKFNKQAVVLNINSKDLETHPVGQIAYNCSKAALEELTHSLARELFFQNILVTSIYLPTVNTDMLKNFNPTNPLPKKILSKKEAAEIICKKLERI